MGGEAMKDRYTIGELSNLFNFSTQTLRYYDKIDLFKPKLIEEENGYRYYTYEQFQDLRTIIYLKNMGISLKEIKKHLCTKGAKHLLNLLEERKRSIDEEIYNLKEMGSQLEFKITEIKNSLFHDDMEKVTLKELPERYIYSMDLVFNIDDMHECLEMLIRNIFIMKKEYPALVAENCGIKIAKSNLKNKKFDLYNSIFMLQNDSIYENIVDVIPSGTFACIYHKGPYNQIYKTYELISKYLDDNKYIIVGDGFEIAALDVKFTSNQREYFTEIQIPISIKSKPYS